MDKQIGSASPLTVPNTLLIVDDDAINRAILENIFLHSRALRWQKTAARA